MPLQLTRPAKLVSGSSSLPGAGRAAERGVRQDRKRLAMFKRLFERLPNERDIKQTET